MLRERVKVKGNCIVLIKYTVSRKILCPLLSKRVEGQNATFFYTFGTLQTVRPCTYVCELKSLMTSIKVVPEVGGSPCIYKMSPPTTYPLKNGKKPSESEGTRGLLAMPKGFNLDFYLS